MMTYDIFAPATTEQIAVPAGQFGASLHALSQDLQTGLIDVEIDGLDRHYLLYARGQLVNVYRSGERVERLEPTGWPESFNISGREPCLRVLALTPQAVRILKIMIEQKGDERILAPVAGSLDVQFANWMEHPFPALAHVIWPNAEALALFPGRGGPPRYTLFVAANQVLHSAGSVMAIYGWKEPYRSAALLSSEPHSLAWTEYLLNHAFSRLVSNMLEKFEQLTGRILLNQVIRDVNFTATAHGWNVRLDAASFTDQSIFSSPKAAAEVYLRLLEVIFRHFANVVGAGMLDMLVTESLVRLAPAYRTVLKEYLPIPQAGKV